MGGGARAVDAAKSDPFTPGLQIGDPYQLCLISSRKILDEYDKMPFGMPVKTVDFCDEWFEFRRDEYEVAQLIALFRRAHAICSADRGLLVMPRWLMVDLIFMPSAALIVLAGQAHLTEAARRLERDFRHPDSDYRRSRAASIRDLLRIAADSRYEGPIPVAAYAALPTPTPGRWVGGSIWWSLLPGQHLGYAARRIALQCFGATQEVGVAQFSNQRALRAQQRFGRLRVINTTLDAHPLPHTFVYEVDLDALPSDGGPAELPAAAELAHVIKLDDPELAEQLDAIQREINDGAGYCVLPGSPRSPDENSRWPMLYRDGDGSKLARVPSVKSAFGQKTATFFTRGIKTGYPYKPYVVSNYSVLTELELKPFGVPLTTIDFRAETFCFHGQSYAVADLLSLFSYANSLSFEEGGLGIPPWAMAELILMPSAVLLILATQAHLRRIAMRLAREPVTDLRQTRLIPLDEDDRDRLHNSNALRELLKAAQERGYRGPLPIAGYAAAPTRRPGYWVGWSLWSLVPGKELGYTVKRLALECYRAKVEAGVAEFGMARGLDVNARFGKLHIIEPYVPAHPAPGAFAYEIDLQKLPPDGSPMGHEQALSWARDFDPEARELQSRQRKMRRDIRRGARYYVLPRANQTKSPLVPIGRSFGARKRILGAVRDKVTKRPHPVRGRTWPD